MRTVAADKLNFRRTKARSRTVTTLQIFRFVVLRQGDDMLAQYDQFDGALFQSIEHLQGALLAEVHLQRPHDLVVIITDSLKLPVELCQSDVIIERRFVDFYDLDFAFEKYGLDEFRVAIQSRSLESSAERKRFHLR